MLSPQQSSTRSVQTADKTNTNGGIFHARNQEHKDHITVDHGYGNIKTANTITPTGITAHESEPIFTRNVLEYNGICYRIGEGHKEFIPDKAIDRHHYLLTLMAIARELNVHSIHEADIHLAAGLPLTWSRNQREEFRSYLLQNPEIRYHFNHKDYHVRLVGCMSNTKNAVLDQFGVKIEEATIEQILRFGTADISAPYLDCITAAARQYVADIFATLRKYEYNPDLLRLYMVGGVGCLLRNFGKYDRSYSQVIALSLVKYSDLYYRTQEDSYLETRERER